MDNQPADHKASAGRSLTWQECSGPNPAPGALVQTACGGSVAYSAQTPCVSIDGQRHYFCLPSCKQDFEQTPQLSCLGETLRKNGYR